MSEIRPPGTAGVPNIRVLAQYAKAVSFISKDGAQVSGQDKPPSIDIGVDLSSDPLQGGDKVYETVIKLMARAHVNDETVFEIDIAYGGVFDVAGSPEDQIEPILMVECPRLLFPFARRIIADITRDGGFPPLLIDPIDFAGLYLQKMQERQDQAPS